MSWINVNDKLPEKKEFVKYEVKLIKGSANPKQCRDVILGKCYKTGFRFMVSDWQTVTHWRDYEI